MKDLELIQGLEKLKAHITSYIHPTEGDIIGNSINVNDIIKETRRALKGGDEAEYRLPDSNEELSQLLFLFENSGPDQLRKLATNDLSVSQMTVRLKWLEATAYRGLTEHVQAGIDQYIPKHAHVSATSNSIYISEYGGCSFNGSSQKFWVCVNHHYYHHDFYA